MRAKEPTKPWVPVGSDSSASPSRIWRDIDGERAGDRPLMSGYGDAFYGPASACELSRGLILTQRQSKSSHHCTLHQGQLRLPDGSVLQWGNYLDNADDACRQCTVQVSVDGVVTTLADVGVHDNFMAEPCYTRGSGLESAAAYSFLARVDSLLPAAGGRYTIRTLVEAVQTWSGESMQGLRKVVHEISDAMRAQDYALRHARVSRHRDR